MTVIEALQKRIEMHIQEMQKEYIQNNVNEKLRLEGQIREDNNLLFILTANKQITTIE
jgi:hypothetical protein